jgi:xanthine dehydrogenase YagS FAD-binding subunit
MLKPFSYIKASSLEEALQHLSSSGAVLHAGGTDLLGCLRDHVFDAGKVVSISGLSHLRGISEETGKGITIGSMTTISDIARHGVIREKYTALSQAASEVASPQLRNQGTIGGNLCQKPRCWYYRGEFHCLRKGGERCFAVAGENHYHCIFGGQGCFIVHPSDTAPALAALNATIRIIGPKGNRSLPVTEFFVPPSRDPRRETVLEPGEVVTSVTLPEPRKGLRSSYRKVKARGAWDFAMAGVALALLFEGDRVQEARVVLSGAAPVPWRSGAAEDALTGRRLDAETIQRASVALVKGAQPLRYNGYKISLFWGIMEEELRKLQ